MIFYKVICHFLCFVEKIYYKIYYSKNLKIGKCTTWRKRFNLLIDNEGFVNIGDDCFFNNDCSITALGRIEIGSGCLFGEGVKIYDHNHKFKNDKIPIKKQGFSIGSVYIGKHCWIGSNVVILKGAYIGDNCVISAGCVVSGNIDKNSIVKKATTSLRIEKMRT